MIVTGGASPDADNIKQWFDAGVSAIGMVNDSQAMVRDRRSDLFEGWLAQCRAPQIGAFERFADTLAQDGTAARAALETDLYKLGK